MAIKILKCISVAKHENADALNVYQFLDKDSLVPIQIVANFTNIYQEGDLVICALEGTTLHDGTYIKSTKVRKVRSEGMALGKAPGWGDYCDEPYVPSPVVSSGAYTSQPSSCTYLHEAGSQVTISDLSGNSAQIKTGGEAIIIDNRVVGPIGPTGPAPVKNKIKE